MLVCLEAFNCVTRFPYSAPRKSFDVSSPVPPASPDTIGFLTKSSFLHCLATIIHYFSHYRKAVMKGLYFLFLVLGILPLGSHTNGLAHQQDVVM